MLQEWMSADALQTQVLGAPLQAWILVVVTWLVLALVLSLAGRLVISRVDRVAQRLVRRTATSVDDAMVHMLRQTKSYLFAGVALYLAFEVTGMPERLTRYAGRLAIVVLLFQTIQWGSSFISFWVKDYERRKLETDPSSVTSMQALAFIGRLVLYTVVALTALATFGVEITALVASLGIGGIAVALALQNILGDLFASLSIILDKPFVVGDFLDVGGMVGNVEKVGLKTTRLRSLSGEQLIFSNSDLLNSRIRNYKRMQERRIAFQLGIVYNTPADTLERVPTVIREVVESMDQVRFDRCHFKNYGDFSLNFETVYHVLVPDYVVFMDVQQEINLRIFRRFEQEGIAFAYPTQTLYVESSRAGAVNGHP
ncbi:MAG: mechanosensitive ion channel family protein [Bacteroidota bacterium]